LYYDKSYHGPYICNRNNQRFNMDIDIKELRKRGYEEDSIRMMLYMKICNLFEGAPDYEEDPQGWLDAHC